MTDHFENDRYLIEAEALEGLLNDPKLRIFDSTTNLTPKPVPALEDFLKGHIPGAQFIDIQADLSDPKGVFPFTLPGRDTFKRQAERLGISNDSRIVVYSTGAPAWATRTWLVLRHFGLDNVALLNGGWQKWVAEGRPQAQGPARIVPPGTLTLSEEKGLFVGKEAVQAAIGQQSVATLNALPPPVHSGATNPGFKRAGHIAGSVNVPAVSLFDAKAGTILPPGELRAAFADSGALERERVIAYCGGGVAATADAFALALLGHKHVTVYDASLNEWAADESLPMEQG